MSVKWISLVLIITSLVISSCSGVSTENVNLPDAGLHATSTPPDTPEPTWTSTPLPTSTVTPTSTPTETQIPTDTSTPPPTYTSTPSEPSPTPFSGEVRSASTDGLEMVYVPEGEFIFGPLTLPISELSRKAKVYLPVGAIQVDKTYTVFLDEFWIDKYEVTADAYKKCIDDGLCNKVYSDELDCSFRLSETYPDIQNPDQHPMNCIAHSYAKKYCESVGKRLPTVFEWTKAARGSHPDHRPYPWGYQTPNCDLTRFDDFGNIYGCDRDWRFAVEVGSNPKGVSPYGVHNMAGNVREWTSTRFDMDWFQGDIPYENPIGPHEGSIMIGMGGSWAEWGAVNMRWVGYNPDPYRASHAQGFRCASDTLP